MRRLLFTLLFLLASCAAPGAIDQRLGEWRAFLAREVPLGTSAADAMAAMDRAGLNPQTGTYVTVMNSGERVANCRDPKQAISGRETSGVRGLYVRYDVEVTVCLSENGRVEKHYVSAWNQGI
jgi:hypothetical protein